MKVKVWGCRGSLPTPGRNTLRYGGESTCVEVESSTGQHVIVDAGSGIRRLGRALLRETSVNHVSLLLTHPHWDHLVGFPFFGPAYNKDFSISLCGGPRAAGSIWQMLTQQMEAPYFPVDYTALQASFTMGCHCDRSVCDHRLPATDGSIACHAIPLNHPNGGYGFKLVGDGRSFVFLTDNEIGFSHEGGLRRSAYVEFCTGADLLFHDAQYTEAEYERKRGWGHSTMMDAVELAIDAGVKRLGLFHHDPDRTDNEIDREVENCRDHISQRGSSLDCFACADGMSIEL